MTLALEAVSVGYDGEGVLADVSLAVDPGEVVTVVGPSGTGKTTLLRTLGLFAPPDDGTVTWDGADVWRLPERERLAVRRRLSMVFQEPALFDASVRRNVTYGLRVRRSWPERLRQGAAGLVGGVLPVGEVNGVLARLGFDGSAGRGATAGADGGRTLTESGSDDSPAVSEADADGGEATSEADADSSQTVTRPDADGDEAVAGSDLDAVVTRALATVGLADLADRNARSLSGGEAQRVAFARALAVDPDVMLLDEPTSDLDPRNTAILEAAIGRARDRGVGVVVATHDMHQAERVSDRVGFVLDGELVELAPPAQLFESPSDPRTRQFVDGELIYAGTEPDV